MKPVSPEMLALLATRQFFKADLWTITLGAPNEGEVFRYCSGDADVVANGFLYSAGRQSGPYWDRKDNKAKITWEVGTNADQLIVDVLPGSATILGDPFLEACRFGIFDGSEIILERAYMPTYGDTRVGVIRAFVGRVAEIDMGRSVATFTINSHLELLNLQFPRNLAMSNCMNNLGDSVCQATVPTTTGTVGASPAPTTSIFAATLGGSFAAGTFDLGTLTWTSGVMSGYSASVLTASLVGTASTITTGGPMPNSPAPGDTFTIAYGCNKSYTDTNGCPKFTNTQHFRGFPFVPQPTVAV